MTTIKTYWNGKGRLQKQYNALNKRLVPKSGKADTGHGELLRVMGNLYYDYYNNGLGNIANFYEEVKDAILGESKVACSFAAELERRGASLTAFREGLEKAKENDPDYQGEWDETLSDSFPRSHHISKELLEVATDAAIAVAGRYARKTAKVTG